MKLEPSCQINQTACGRQAGNPMCPKCGIDDRVVYPGQGDLEVALANARTRYLESHVRLLEQEILAARKALETVVNAEAQKQAELEAEKKARKNAEASSSETLLSLQSLEKQILARDALCEQLTNDLSSVSGELTAVRDRAMGVNYRQFKLEALGFGLISFSLGVSIFIILFLRFNWQQIFTGDWGFWILTFWLVGFYDFFENIEKFKNKWRTPLLCYQDLKAEQQKNKLSKYSAKYRFLTACKGIADGIPKPRGTP